MEFPQYGIIPKSGIWKSTKRITEKTFQLAGPNSDPIKQIPGFPVKIYFPFPGKFVKFPGNSRDISESIHLFNF